MNATEWYQVPLFELVTLIVCFLGLALLTRAAGTRPDFTRWRRLHRDQVGGVQSLSFVLAVPVFVAVLMMIVQISQLMVGRLLVQYAAFAAARSAQVWIPANTGFFDEQENEIAVLRPAGEIEEDNQTFTVYKVAAASPKVNRIQLAAAMACMPICPSRDTGAGRAHPGNQALESVRRAYLSLAPSEAANRRVPPRLENKLAYALENTYVDIEIRHKDSEPPLHPYGIGPYREEFTYNEIGWQDQLVVTVAHDFALLPGPGRLLLFGFGNGSSSRDADDYGTAQAGRRGNTLVYRLKSTVRLNNEGQKPILPYIQRFPWAGPPPDEPPEDPDYPDEPDDEVPDSDGPDYEITGARFSASGEDQP